MKPSFRARRPLATTSVILVVLTGLSLRAAPPAAAALTSLTLNGHGFGHGRGAGQYGALGYAQGGWSANQILDRYYGGTTDGTQDPNRQMTVRMTIMDSKPTVVTQERGQLFTDADDSLPGGRKAHTALKIERVAAGTFAVSDGPGCDGPWTPRASLLHATTVVTAPGVKSEDRSQNLQLCEPTGAHRWMFGELVAVDADNKQYTANSVPTDQYLRGVVPREMPASWGDNVGGKGMEALKTQAVAARSYAISENRYSFAKTCDTTECQVYGGRAVQTGATFTNLEDSRTNTAVAATAGHVRLLNGAVAHTEYSSSTGGYTAGGTFPPVFDEGDAVANNPYHNWSQTIPASTIEAKYGKGTLQSAAVTQRNGLGTDGGRVVTLHLVFSGGAVDVSGNDFAAAFGLKSNWWTVSGTTGGKYNALVPARILDTRAGQPAADDWSDPWPANGIRTVQVAGRGGVPAGASAVALNVTAVNASAGSGWLTVFPSDVANPPNASNVNFTARKAVPNLVIVKLAPDGLVKIFNSSNGTTDVIADVVGYFGTETQSTDGRFAALPPARVLDSRPGEAAADDWNTPWPDNTARDVVIGGRGGVPPDATAVALNFTVVNTQANGYLTVWPAGASRPVASNLNWTTGQVVANRVIVKLGAGLNAGKISVYNAVGSTNVIADVVGYFTSGTAPSGSSGLFYAIAPTRLLDSRPGASAPDPYSTPWPAGGQRPVTVANVAGIPASISGVVLNVAVVNATASGWLTLFPTGTPPTASDLNFGPGLAIANLALAKVHTDGTLQVYNWPGGTTDVIADATGYFS
jgi:SpoIID/LytB domain protein